MKLLLLPDLAAMAILLSILYFLRIRHPREAVNLWLIGLLFIFLEAVVHAAYPAPGPWRLVAHVIALNFFFIAGAIFLWASCRDIFPRKQTYLYLLVNALPASALLTVYGLAVRDLRIYHAVAAVGLFFGVASAFGIAWTWKLRRGWWLLLAQCRTWIPIWFFSSAGDLRNSAYF